MEIRDPVHGSMYFSDAEVNILDTVEFQRLRSIKQLGFSEFSFPGATHNRYIHSVGVCHLVGLAFDSIFRAFPFSKPSIKTRFRQTVRLAALLHDVGHGPLSHTTEQSMPQLADVNVKLYQHPTNRQANHEDYTIKYVTETTIAEKIKSNLHDISPKHVAQLIDKLLPSDDHFFVDNGVDFRPILCQLVSSELDVDRMDYLERDSYFCGTNYGRIDLHWLIQNMTFHRINDRMYLAINRRALYSFDDFLLARHHMHLMVYCHHKSIIYEELLNKYLSSKDCQFVLPYDINEYTKYNDYKLYEHLAGVDNPWARRIAERSPYKVLMELHNTEENTRPEKIKKALEEQGLDVIWASTKTRLSKYHATGHEEGNLNIFVVDQFDHWDQPVPLNQSTQIFKRYEGTRIIDRIYVAPEKFTEAEKLLKQAHL